MNEKQGEKNNKTYGITNDEKTQVKETEKNIKQQKDFAEEMKELEKQREEEIKNMKNDDADLKQKNAQLILMLNIIESKLV